MDSLTDFDCAILDLEARRWATVGAKEQVIRDEIGMTPVRYYLRLNQLLNLEAALAHDAVTVNRLLRLRARRPHSLRSANAQQRRQSSPTLRV